MGHYDGSRDYEEQQELVRVKDEIMDELEQVSTVRDMYSILQLIRRREKIETMFELFDRGLK